jgi:hypothetical protein
VKIRCAEARFPEVNSTGSPDGPESRDVGRGKTASVLAMETARDWGTFWAISKAGQIALWRRAPQRRTQRVLGTRNRLLRKKQQLTEKPTSNRSPKNAPSSTFGLLAILAI